MASVDPRVLRQLTAGGVLDIIGPDGVVMGDERIGAAVERAVADAHAWIRSSDPSDNG